MGLRTGSADMMTLSTLGFGMVERVSSDLAAADLAPGEGLEPSSFRSQNAAAGPASKPGVVLSKIKCGDEE